MYLDLHNGFKITAVRRSDCAALVEQLNDRDIYAQTLRIPYPYTLDAAESFLTFIEKSTEQNGQPVNWAIRNEADKLIGGLGFDLEGIGTTHRAEIGYWLTKPLWGHGIMTTAVRSVCQYAFEHLALVKVTAHVFAFNPASARVLEKCGFEREGYLKKHYQKDGQYIDGIAYGLLRPAHYEPEA